MNPRTKWFVIYAVSAVVSGLILYAVEDPVDPFAPKWLAWPLLAAAILSSLALMRLLRPKNFIKDGVTRDRSTAGESAEKGVAMLGAVSISLPLVFGIIATRATGIFWPYLLFLLASALFGTLAWYKVGVIQGVLRSSLDAQTNAQEPPN